MNFKNKRKGFSLVELTVYMCLLALSCGMFLATIKSSSKMDNYLANISRFDKNNRVLIDLIEDTIEKSTKVPERFSIKSYFNNGIAIGNYNGEVVELDKKYFSNCKNKGNILAMTIPRLNKGIQESILLYFQFKPNRMNMRAGRIVDNRYIDYGKSETFYMDGQGEFIDIGTGIIIEIKVKKRKKDKEILYRGFGKRNEEFYKEK